MIKIEVGSTWRCRKTPLKTVKVTDVADADGVVTYSVLTTTIGDTSAEACRSVKRISFVTMYALQGAERA